MKVPDDARVQGIFLAEHLEPLCLDHHDTAHNSANSAAGIKRAEAEMEPTPGILTDPALPAGTQLEAGTEAPG